MDALGTCPICFEDLKDKETVSPDVCEHIFCFPCLQKWTKIGGSICPADRKRFKKIIDRNTFKAIQIKPRKRKKRQPLYDVSHHCEVCLKSDDGDTLLLCDCCDLAYHCKCLTPPLSEVPQGVWHCPLCVAVADNMRLNQGITKNLETIASYHTNYDSTSSSSESKSTEEAKTKLSFSEHIKKESASRIEMECTTSSYLPTKVTPGSSKPRTSESRSQTNFSSKEAKNEFILSEQLNKKSACQIERENTVLECTTSKQIAASEQHGSFKQTYRKYNHNNKVKNTSKLKCLRPRKLNRSVIDFSDYNSSEKNMKLKNKKKRLYSKKSRDNMSCSTDSKLSTDITYKNVYYNNEKKSANKLKCLRPRQHMKTPIVDNSDSNSSEENIELRNQRKRVYTKKLCESISSSIDSTLSSSEVEQFKPLDLSSKKTSKRYELKSLPASVTVAKNNSTSFNVSNESLLSEDFAVQNINDSGPKIVNIESLNVSTSLENMNNNSQKLRMSNTYSNNEKVAFETVISSELESSQKVSFVKGISEVMTLSDPSNKLLREWPLGEPSYENTAGYDFKHVDCTDFKQNIITSPVKNINKLSCEPKEKERPIFSVFGKLEDESLSEKKYFDLTQTVGKMNYNIKYNHTKRNTTLYENIKEIHKQKWKSYVLPSQRDRKPSHRLQCCNTLIKNCSTDLCKYGRYFPHKKISKSYNQFVSLTKQRKSKLSFKDTVILRNSSSRSIPNDDYKHELTTAWKPCIINLNDNTPFKQINEEKSSDIIIRTKNLMKLKDAKNDFLCSLLCCNDVEKLAQRKDGSLFINWQA